MMTATRSAAGAERKAGGHASSGAASMRAAGRWVVGNGCRVALLGLPGGVGDASRCSTAQDGAGGTHLARRDVTVTEWSSMHSAQTDGFRSAIQSAGDALQCRRGCGRCARC